VQGGIFIKDIYTLCVLDPMQYNESVFNFLVEVTIPAVYV